jgi:hypothetical protein
MRFFAFMRIERFCENKEKKLQKYLALLVKKHKPFSEVLRCILFILFMQNTSALHPILIIFNKLI